MRVGVWASVVQKCVLFLGVAITALVAAIQAQPDHRHIVILVENMRRVNVREATLNKKMKKICEGRISDRIMNEWIIMNEGIITGT